MNLIVKCYLIYSLADIDCCCVMKSLKMLSIKIWVLTILMYSEKDTYFEHCTNIIANMLKYFKKVI